MTPKNKKICLLFAGGTVLSEKELISINKESDIENWLSRMPELSIMAELGSVFICGENEILSGKDLWRGINSEIFKRLKEFDGFIVTTGVNAVLYNSLAACFAFENLNKPIIFTSSQLPIVEKDLIDLKKKTFGGLGVKANLINAVQVATMDFPVVGLMFGNGFLKATRAERSTFYALNIFTSADNKYLARIDFGISPQEKLKAVQNEPALRNVFEEEVAVLEYFPGFKIKDCYADYKGLFIESQTIGGFAPGFIKDLEKIKIPAVLYNKFYVPKLNKANIMELFGITKEAAVVKFMWALGQTKKMPELRSIMLNDCRGEFFQHLF